MLARFGLNVLIVVLLCLTVSCAWIDDSEDSSNAADDDDSAQEDDDDDIVSDDDDNLPECPQAMWEYLTIDSYQAPANPITGDLTPAKYNKAKYFRFRGDTGDQPPSEVGAILIILPGFTVGASYLSYAAKSLVELSCGQVEVWLPERRHKWR